MALKVIYQGPNGAVAIDAQQNVTVSANYTVQPSDYIVTATGAGSFDITLPQAAPNNGRAIVIKCLTTAAITVKAYAGEFIDLVASKSLSNGETLDIVSDGVRWVDTVGSTISGTRIIDGTITNTKLSSSAVTETKIASSAVTETKIADNAVTANKIATGAVGNDEINTSATPTVNTIYTNNWFRSNGATGWYNETYGGGIWMNDFDYVKVYNNKAFMPSSGNGTNGIIFPLDPGGGSGDAASIKYFASNIDAGAFEDTKLQIKVENDNNDRIVLQAPAGIFEVGKSFNADSSISGWTTGQIEFRYAASSSTRYLRLQTDGNMVIYNELGTTALWASGTYSSDIKLKENIKKYSDSAIDVIKKLNVVSFNYKKEIDFTQSNKIGFIAQEVENIIPQAVKLVGPKPESQTFLLYKEEIVPILTKAIQEQQEQIQSLEERIKKLEELIKS